MSDISANGPRDRHGGVLAPGGLGLVQSLLNSRAAGTQYEDQLIDLASAQDWLTGTLRTWADEKAVDAPDVELTAQDLPRIRGLRDEIKSMLLGSANPEARLTTQLKLLMTADTRVTIHPQGRRANGWIRSAILAECFTAQLTGTWSRLKICADPECNAAFYDRSRNCSGVWHDVHVCGNRFNLRASRARRQSSGGD